MNRRAVALVVVLVVVAAACTSASQSTTTTAPEGAVDPRATSLFDSLPSSQTVQDFVIHLDLSVQSTAGTVSFYEDVLAHAFSDAGTGVDLDGGFVLKPVNSLEGKAIDAAGATLPSIRVDYGLISLTPESLASDMSAMAQAIEQTVNPEAHAGLTEPGSGQASLLVEIITADLSMARTHIGPGDKTAVDLSALTSVVPGDRVTAAYFFGQTRPGDPRLEAGMSPYELFVFRWNLGLISILGNSQGTQVVTDDTLEAIAGSTILTRRGKEALLGFGFLEAAVAVENVSDKVKKGEVVSIPSDSETHWYLTPHGMDGFTNVHICSDGGCNQPLKMRSELVTPFIRLNYGLVGCSAVAGVLNAANAHGGVTPEDLEEIGDILRATKGTGEGQTTATQPQDETSPSTEDPNTEPSDPPGPVSCVPPEGDGMPPPPPSPPAGIWHGDVHVATFDGLGYDNQAVGEFLAFDNRELQVQVRLGPVENSQGASIVTAVAARVGDHTVSLHPIGETWIDGDLVVLERGIPTTLGNAEILRSASQWILAASDGTIVQIDDNIAGTTDSMVVRIIPSQSPSIGMLGSPDGNPDNDLITREGELVEPHVRFDLEAFHSRYVDSWRITQDESIFHYQPGETTDTFLIEGFPNSWLTVRDLSEQQRADGERICREMGVTRSDIIDSCVFDVGLTGNAGFAFHSYVAQSSTAELVSGTSAVEQGDAKAELSIGSLKLDLDQDSAASWQCQADEETFWVLASYVESKGTLELTVQYADADASGSGEPRLDLTLFLDGSPYAWLVPWSEVPTGSLDSATLQGNTLTANGLAFLKASPEQDLSLLSVIPESDWQSFSLQVTCDQ